MKDYLKMADVFDMAVEPKQLSGWKHQGRYIELKRIQEVAAHAINSHDELVRANKELLIHLERCAKELTSMINRHNKQSMEDGSWLYDQQTPYEAMWLIDRLNGIKPPAKDTINCDLYVAGGEA